MRRLAYDYDGNGATMTLHTGSTREVSHAKALQGMLSWAMEGSCRADRTGISLERDPARLVCVGTEGVQSCSCIPYVVQ